MLLIDHIYINNLLGSLIVSRETSEKLQLYDNLLKKWNSIYNLVDKKTLDCSTSRHFLDCLQLAKHMDPNKPTVDIGSGAGFPGLILAIIGFKKITLVESNRKKVIFLSEVARLTSTNVNIINERVEKIDLNFEQFTARGFAKVNTILKLFKDFSQNSSPTGYLLKGKNFQNEINEALKTFSKFDWELFPSLVANDSYIIKIWNISNDDTL